MNDYFKKPYVGGLTPGTIVFALKEIRDAYYALTAKNLQEFVLTKEVYEALQREIYLELNLNELPNNITLYGMAIRQENVA